MKSIKNIKRLYNNEIYISISINEAIKLQEKGINLLQFGNLKSIFVKESDFALLNNNKNIIK